MKVRPSQQACSKVELTASYFVMYEVISQENAGALTGEKPYN